MKGISVVIRSYPRFAAELEGHGIKVPLPQIAGQQLDAAGMREALAGQQLVIAGDDTNTPKRRLTGSPSIWRWTCSVSGQLPRLGWLMAA